MKEAHILIPPGLGDVYWIIVKLEAFMQSREIEHCILHSWSSVPDRTKDFINRFSFCSAGDAHPMVLKDNRVLYKALNFTDDTYFVENHEGFDFLFWFNGALDAGKNLEREIMPEIETNWYPEMSVPDRENLFYEEYKEKYGDFLLSFYPTFGFYKTHWLPKLTLQKYYDLLKNIHDTFNLKIILSGLDSDIAPAEQLLEYDGGRILIDLTGKTDFTQLSALIRASTVFLGVPAGNTIYSTYIKQQTIMIWANRFLESFSLNACPPDSINQWYHSVWAEFFSEEHIMQLIWNIMLTNDPQLNLRYGSN